MRNQYKVLSEKYNLIQENDKDDIMAGLDELSNILPPKGKVPYYMVKMESDGLFPDYADEVVNEVIPSSARKALPGVYIETKPSPNTNYPDGVDADGFYTLYVTDPNYIEVFMSYKENGYFTDEAFNRFLQPLYEALGMYGGGEPVLPG